MKIFIMRRHTSPSQFQIKIFIVGGYTRQNPTQNLSENKRVPCSSTV